MSPDLPSWNELPSEDGNRIHQECLAYEKALVQELDKSGRPPPLDRFVDALPEPLRPVLRRELLAIEREWWPCLPGYETVLFLGMGGMGRVYRVRCLATNQEVAIKRLLGGERERRGRLARLASIKHEHLVEIYGFLEDEDNAYLIMQLIDGRDLAKQLDELCLDDQRLRIHAWHERKRRVVALMAQIAEAVRHLHHRSVMHRDLKPNNVLLDLKGQAYVCDFGLAKEVGASDGPTEPAVALGTRKYMAPEQARGTADLTLAADVWSLGAMLYEWLTGRPPFVSPNGLLAEDRKEGEDGPPLPSTVNDRLAGDPDLDHICARCLAREPGNRYQDAAALADDLHRYLDGQPVAPRETWRDWFSRKKRALNRDRREEDYYRRHSWSLLREAATALVAHLGMFALLQSGVPGQVLWLWLIVTEVSPGWLNWLIAIGRRAMSPMERDVLQLWAGVGVANLVLFALYCPFWGPASAADVVRYYPGLAVVLGLVFFAEGHFCWDRFYWVGAVYFGAALLLPQAGIWAPVAFGLLYTTTFVWLGSQAWRLHSTPSAPIRAR